MMISTSGGPASRLFPKMLQMLLAGISWDNLWCSAGFEHVDPHVGERPAIIALWHEYLAVVSPFLPLITKRKDRNAMSMSVLVSQHKDGQLAGRIANEFGVIPVAGSTTRGGSNAIIRLSQLIKYLKVSVLITPDGPRGPRRTSGHELPFRLLGDIPILLAAIASRKLVRLSSWDNMMLPSPSNTSIALVSTAMILNPFCKAETRAAVIIRLNGAAQRAERLC